MGKVILVIVSIGILAFSAAQTYARPGAALPAPGRAAGAAAAIAASSAAHTLLSPAGRISGPPGDPARGLRLQDTSGENDGPALALLIYLGCILVGSAVGVGLVRRGQHEL